MMDIEEITLEELKEPKLMKNNRAPGLGNHPIELFKHATTGGLEIIYRLFNKCLREKK